MAGIDWEKGQITPPKQTSAQEGATDWEKGDIQKPSGFVRKAGDLGLSLLKGAVAIPEAAVGLADIPTGGRVGKFLENEGGAIGFRPKQAKEVISGWQSDDLRSKSQAFQNADGVIDKAATAISNPSLVANAVAESLPLMGAGGVLARGLMAVAPGVGAVGAGAIGEGVMGAGSAAEQMRQETADGTLTAKQAALAGLSGAATAGFGALGGKVAQKLGIGDVDTMIAKGSINAGSVPGKGFIRRGAEGALSEGLLEELPQSLSEQAIQNIGLDKPIAEGMADAAVMGTLAGAAMGGGAGVLSGFGQEPQQAAPGQPPAPAGTQPAAPTDRGFNPQALQAEQNARLDTLAAEEAGTTSVAQTAPPDGAAALAAQRAQAEQARLAQLEASRSEPSPDDEIFQSTGADVASFRPSQAMGLDPAAGPMSAAAALAVDGGATARVQAEQALNAAAEAAPKTKTLDEASPEERAAYDAATFDPARTKQGVTDRRKAAIEGLMERAALQSEGQILAQEDAIDPPFELGGQKNGQPDAAGGKPGNAGADTGLADAGRAAPDAARVPGTASADTAGQPQRFAALSGLEPMAKATPGQKVKSLKEFMAKKKAEREAPNVQDQTPGTAGAQTQAAADQAPQAVGGQPAGAAAGVPAAGGSGVEAAGVSPASAEYKRQVDAWNAKVNAFKAASPEQQSAMRPEMDAAQASMEKARQGLMKEADADFKRQQAEQREKDRAEKSAKYGAMPQGTRIGIAGQEKNDSAYWEKTGPDEWTRVGIGSDQPKRPSADMEGGRIISKPASPAATAIAQLDNFIEANARTAKSIAEGKKAISEHISKNAKALADEVFDKADILVKSTAKRWVDDPEFDVTSGFAKYMPRFAAGNEDFKAALREKIKSAPVETKADLDKLTILEMTEAQLRAAAEIYPEGSKRATKARQEIERRSGAPTQPTTGKTDGTQAPQAQQAEAQGSQAPAAAAAVTDDLGAQWSRMTTVERQALATRAGVKGVAAKNLATRAWDAMDPIQRDRLRKGFEPVKAAEADAGQQAAAPEAGPKEPSEVTHNGTRIYRTRAKLGDEVKDMWAVESPENKARRAAGERTLGGDTLHDTIEQAKASADREAKQFAERKAFAEQQDAEERARKEAEEARKASNRGKSILERRKDAVLDGPTKLPASAGLGNTTRRNAMQMAVEQGRAVVERQVDDSAAKKRDQEAVDRVRRAGYMLGLSNENIPVVKAGLEAQARLKANDYKKPEYRVYGGSEPTGSFYEITKTEYEYAQELMSKKAQDPVVAPAPAPQSDDFLPDGWTKSVNGYTKRPVYRMEQDLGQPFAVVTQTEGMTYEVQIRHGDKQLTASTKRGALSEVLAAAKAELAKMTQAASVTHQDPGEKPEAATKGVVADSLKAAAKNEDTKPSEMRKWLLAEIDKELLQAPDRADYDEAVKRMGEKDAISMFTGSGFLGKNAETGFITFDVPGDGKFKVRNSVRGLLEFRKTVMASPGFKDSGQRTKAPEQNDGAQDGSGSKSAAVLNMIEEGDFEAARDYAEAVGINLEDVKVPRGDRKPQWEKFQKDGTLPPAAWMPSKEWQFQDIGASSFVPDSEKKSATLIRVADGSTYVATVKGSLDNTSAKYTVTKDGKEIGRSTTRAPFSETLRMAEDAMPEANDKPAPSKSSDTGWNMAGTGYGGKRYRGRNITLDDGREVVARIYENAGRYNEVEIKVDGARKFTVIDEYNAQDKADAFIKTLTGNGRQVDYKGFERTPKGNGSFELRDGNMVVTVEPMGQGKFQASFRGAKSSPHLQGEQGAVDWADAYRKDAGSASQQDTAISDKMTPRQFDDWIRQRATIQTEQFRGDRNHGGGDEGVGYIHLSGKIEAGGTNWAGTARGAQDKRDTRLIFRTDDNKIVWYDDASQQVYEVPKDDARLEITRPEPTPKQARDPHEITVTVDGADYTVTFDEPLATISNQAFQDNLDEYGTPGVAKAEFRKLRAQAQAGGASESAATGARRDPTKVSMFNPYNDGDIVTIDGQDWTVKADTPGWYLTTTGNWRGAHPTIRNIKAMADLIREVEQAAEAKPAAQADAPKLTQAEAKELMEWQDLGQKGGIKTHILTFYASKADKNAKRGRMIVATVTKEADSKNWVVDGTDERLAMLGMAKKKAEEAGMDRAVADGFVEPAQPTEAPAQPKTVKQVITTARAKKAAEAEAQRAEYFAPGNILKGYGGHDRVLEYTPPDENGRWSVRVQRVVKQGEQWVDAPNERPRWHSTPPEAKELAAGPVVKATAAAAPMEYPLAPAGSRYEETNKPITMMTPDAYLAAVRPLEIDEASRDNIDDLKQHILSGRKLDPLRIRADGKEDGRHRAVAAKELGIRDVPVIDERATAATGAVENFGEKLPPARRAMAAKLSEDLTDEKIASMPLSQIWPASENEAIEDVPTAAAAHVMREAIPAKPRVAYKVKSWVEKVKFLREFTAKVVRGDISREKLMGEMQKIYALRDLASKIKLLEQIDRSQWKRIGEVSEAPNAVRYEGGTAIPVPSVGVSVDGKNHWLRGSGDVLTHLDAIKAMLGTDAPESRMQFEIRQESRGERKVFINKKGDKEQRRLMEFATVAEARKAINEQYADLVAAWEGVKARDNITERDLRSDTNRERAGKDHRKGRDVTPAEFESKFGFRGGEFGKWVGQGNGAQERQFMLNSAYDALMDLSDLLGIPPKAISLEGSLGIAFGSRGSGWASAHFEPSNLVINLTKTRGAGALAHEWFHALDNYFARKRNGGEVPIRAGTDAQNEYRRNNFITHKTSPMMVRKDGRGTPVTKERLAEWRKQNANSGYLSEDQWMEDPSHKQGVRAEVEQAFADLVKALNDTPMLKRARRLDGVKDADGYWSRMLEMAARSFENYVQTRMMEQGYHNDFLANVKEAPEVGKNIDRYPYLLPSEVAPVADAFQALFETIKTRQDDAGNVVLFSQGLLAPTAMGPKPTVQAVQALVGKVQAVSKDVLPVSVVGNPSEVPGLQVPAGTQPTGVLTGGRIYLFADNFGTLGEAYATLFHEIFHLGLQRVIPAEDYAALLKKFANGAQVQQYMRQWKSSPEGRQRANTMPSAAYEALATEEALAMVAEELSESGIGTNRMPGLAKKMLSWLADVADRLGFPGAFGNWVRGLTQTQAERFVSDMTRAVLGGARNLAKTQAKYGTMAKEMTQQTRLRSDAQEAELAELFNALQAPRGVKLAQAQRQVSAHPMAEQIRNIEANFMDMLAHLDDAKLVQINC